MRVAYVGAYNASYPRNRIIIEGLTENGVEVIEHNLALQGTKSESFQKRRIFSVLRLFVNQIKYQASLAWTLVRIRNVDAIVVGFPGFQDLPLSYLATRLKRVPLVFDPLVSVHETLVEDRGLYSSSSMFARFVFAIEKVLFRLPDLVIADTDVHASFFAGTYGARRVSTSYVGASSHFYDVHGGSGQSESLSDRFKVLFYGSYIPLHGIEYIVEAARILKDQNIRFEIIGAGQIFDTISAQVIESGSENVRLVDWATRQEIVKAIAEADLCLGIFGLTPKANRVIPNKVFECLAAGKPVLTRDSDAAREVLNNGINVFFCEPGSAAAIAESILKIRDSADLAAAVSLAASTLSRDRFSPRAIGESVLDALNEVRAA